MKISRLVFVICLVLGLSACSSTPKNDNELYSGVPAKQLFKAGEEAMANQDYDFAVKQFESLDAQYPFSKYSQQAQLDVIYAYYKSGDRASAVAAADRYIRLYPRSKHVDYAYYIKGVANFYQDRGIFTKFLPIDQSWRDPGTSLNAYDDFATLIRRFPDSPYVVDARQRMIYLRNMFAQRELHIGNYYYKRRAYVAAANRATYLLNNYHQAPQAEKALVLLIKADRKLGLKKPAADALATLRMNYPNSKALKTL